MDKTLLCGSCITKPPYYNLARSLFKFDLNSKKLIHGFKYNDQTSKARIFAKIIMSRYRAELQDVDFIIPVPMHRIKRIFRQYNPAQVLALELSKQFAVPMTPDILIKTKWTKPQTKLNKNQRQKNLAGSIIVNNKKNISGAKVLLVDDVRTTGTTGNTCARLLKQSGAAEVKLITIGLA
jgi:ComF family protein